ncbi:hypothetical protein C8R42DRAFT_649003 [Lentinula raphanica]|nr:hypothetical protein C8R42DRAFT_649003 [Lentinula raphanica]
MQVFNCIVNRPASWREHAKAIKLDKKTYTSIKKVHKRKESVTYLNHRREREGGPGEDDEGSCQNRHVKQKHMMVAAFLAMERDTLAWTPQGQPNWADTSAVDESWGTPPRWKMGSLRVNKAMEFISTTPSGYHYYNVKAITPTTMKEWNKHWREIVMTVAKGKKGHRDRINAKRCKDREDQGRRPERRGLDGPSSIHGTIVSILPSRCLGSFDFLSLFFKSPFRFSMGACYMYQVCLSRSLSYKTVIHHAHPETVCSIIGIDIGQDQYVHISGYNVGSRLRFSLQSTIPLVYIHCPGTAPYKLPQCHFQISKELYLLQAHGARFFVRFCLLKTSVAALPTAAVQELVPRETLQKHNLRLDRHARAGNSKGEDPIVESIDLGLIQFASINDRKDTFRTARQNAAASKLLDPWQYTDDIMDSLLLLHSIPSETMKTWEGVLIENKFLAFELTVMRYVDKAQKFRTGDFELHVGDVRIPFKNTKRDSKKVELELDFSTHVYFRNRRTMEEALSNIERQTLSWGTTVPSWFQTQLEVVGSKAWQSRLAPWIRPIIRINRAMELLSWPKSAGYQYYDAQAMATTTLMQWKEIRDDGVRKMAKRKKYLREKDARRWARNAETQRRDQEGEKLQEQGDGPS